MRYIILIIIAMTCLFVTPGWSENRCKTYDYQEIKDMDEQELTTEIKITLASGLSETKYANKLLELGKSINNREYKLADAAANHCQEQTEKLMKMRSKKFPTSK